MEKPGGLILRPWATAACSTAVAVFASMALIFGTRLWLIAEYVLPSGSCARGLGGGPRVAMFAAVAAGASLPFGWQNALWGFQSQHYIGLALALVSIVCEAHAPANRSLRLCGWMAAALSLFVGGLGTITCVALAATAGLCSRFPKRSRTDLLSSCAYTGLAVVGWMMLHPVEGHAYLRTQTLGQFVSVFSSGLAFPALSANGAALLLWAPVMLVLGARIRFREPITPLVRLILGLGMLAILHASAVAFARGAGLPEASPISRYQEVLFLGVIANLLALADSGLWTKFASMVRRGLAVLWIGTVLIGFTELSGINLRLHLPYKAESDQLQQSIFESFLENRAEISLRGRSFHEIGHISEAGIKAALESELLRVHLSHSLKSGSVRSRVELVLNGLVRSGFWLAVLGTALLFGWGAMVLWNGKMLASASRSADSVHPPSKP